MEKKFKVFSKYSPAGDQINAIEKLSEGIEDGLKQQVLLGVTGSGKTFTMAKIIEQVQKPTLVLAHNKTLAAQLCNEFREFFPENRVEFFVSYYDYYQPEAYISSTDTYIEKDSAINEEIEKLRHSATASLSERRDVIVVASVSCIFGLGNPKDYLDNQISLRKNDEFSQTKLIKKLLEIQYERNEIEFKRGTFRVKGDSINIFPPYSNSIYYRIDFFGDEVETIKEVDAITGKIISTLTHISIYPATHYAVGSEKLKEVLKTIKTDCEKEVKNFEQSGKLIEAQRLKERTNYDIEMMSEIGYCSGIENYSRYFDKREVGEPPYTLMDYFPKDFVLFVDESHITLPQVRAMFNGDRSRKQNLVDYGFRVKAALDNRPLTFEEFRQRINQVVYVSATPAKYELELADNVVEQIIRPTGLLDPEIEVVKTEGQIENLIKRINATIADDGRVLITTLTKKMSEMLTSHLQDKKIRVKYLHSEIDTLERIEIVNGLRAKEFDVIVGINLLREGLDIPEVKLVAILDADKEGFLRSETSLIQTIGRAARNKDAKVVMFADVITDSMKRAINETNRRRKIQNQYNIEHNIVPQTIVKEIKNTLEITKKESLTKIDVKDIPEQIEKLKSMMNICASNLDFEQAINLRDQIAQLNKVLKE